MPLFPKNVHLQIESKNKNICDIIDKSNIKVCNEKKGYKRLKRKSNKNCI